MEGRYRGGNPHKVEEGNGALMIRADTTAEQKIVARGLLLDPGGGSISTGGGKIVHVYPEITGKWRRNNPGEGQGTPAGGVFIHVHTAEIEQDPG